MEKIKRKDILIREFNRYEENRIMLELKIAHQGELDPNEMSADKILSRNSQGQPASTKRITRKEHIGIMKEELEGVELALKIIEEQMK